MNRGIKKLEQGLYRVRVTQVCSRTGRKKDSTRVVRGSLHDAELARAELLLSVQSQAAPSKERIHLKDWLAFWLEKHADEWKFSTTRRRISIVNSIAKTEWGSLYLDAMGPADVEDLLRHFHKEKRWSGNTCRQVLEILRTSTRDAVKHRVIDRWPCDGAKNPVAVRTNRKAHTIEEAFKLLAACQSLAGKPHPTMVAMSLLTGMRWCEVSALEMDDLKSVVVGEKKLHYFSVRRAQVNGRIGTTKTGKERDVPAHTLLVEMIAALPKTSGQLMFASRHGKHLWHSKANDHLAALCKLADVPRITWHELRHTTNDLLRRFTDKLVLQKMIGHSDDSTTAIYSHVDMGEMGAAQDQLVKLMLATKVGGRVGGADMPN